MKVLKFLMFVAVIAASLFFAKTEAVAAAPASPYQVSVRIGPRYHHHPYHRHWHRRWHHRRY